MVKKNNSRVAAAKRRFEASTTLGSRIREQRTVSVHRPQQVR